MRISNDMAGAGALAANSDLPAHNELPGQGAAQSKTIVPGSGSGGVVFGSAGAAGTTGTNSLTPQTQTDQSGGASDENKVLSSILQTLQQLIARTEASSSQPAAGQQSGGQPTSAPAARGNTTIGVPAGTSTAGNASSADGNVVSTHGHGITLGDPASTNTAGSTDTGSSTGSTDSTVTASSTGTSSTGGAAPATATSQPTAVSSAAPAAAPTSTPQTSQTASQADFLDNSKYSSPDQLKKYDSLVANLPPDQRLQAEKELNRPVAAAEMAAAGGADGDKAKAFIDANPALKTAMDVGKHGGKADGNTTTGDYKAFAKSMQSSLSAAGKDVDAYTKANPHADPQSLQMVTNAALLRANEPIAKYADPKDAASSDDKDSEKYVTAGGLNGLAKGNPGLSGLLTTAAKSFAQPGFLNLLDQGGMSGTKLAKNSPDGKISTANMDDWIKKQAPATGGQFASMMGTAATLNAVSNTDISKLGADVFDNPQKYSGEQKAAVMVKLQQTQESVEAGSKLRKTDKTDSELTDKINQLQSDPDVQSFLNKQVPQQESNLINTDPALAKAVKQRGEDVASGKALSDDMNAADQAASTDKDGKPLKNPTLPDYSTALGNSDAELQLQNDLSGKGSKGQTTADLLAKNPELSAKVQDNYQKSFTEGGAVQEGLKQKGAKPDDVLSDVDSRKAAYDSALPPSVGAAAEDGYMDATVAALKTTKGGVDALKGFKEATAGLKNKDPKDITGADLKNAADADGKDKGPGAKEIGGGVFKAASGIYSFASVSSLLKSGQKGQAAKAIYDGTRSTGTAARVGYNAATKGSTSGAEIAGKVAGRAVGAIAGRVAGAAAAEAVGATVPVVGWIADAAMSLGFGIEAIIKAVQKHKDQKAFDHNVDPTLKQFGIDKPK